MLELTFARARYYLLMLAAVLVAVLGAGLAGRYYEEISYGSEREVVLERLGNVRYQLESHISSNLSLINGLAAFVSAYPDFTTEQFEQYASKVIARDPTLLNLAVAPDLVVRFVYPYAGNEAVLGLDYRTQPDQWPVVERVINTGGLVVAGPVNLVQGGIGLIGRAPVYVDEPDRGRVLWGIVSAPILADSVFEQAGLSDGVQNLDIAIRGTDGLGADGEVFWGDALVFAEADSILMPVNIGTGSWQMGARVNSTVTAGVYGIRLFAVMLALLMLGAIWQRQRRLEERAALLRKMTRNERFLRSVEAVSRVGGWRLSSTGKFTELTEQTRKIVGLEPGSVDITVESFCAPFEPQSADLLQEQFFNALQHRNRFDVELQLVTTAGETRWLHVQGEPLVQDNRFEITGAITDITEAKQSESLIEYQANYDALTGLPNRNLFLDRLRTALLFARRRSTRLAVLFINLDNFKSVNDNLGHDAGDELLIECGKRISACVREVDTVARYSGDEFVAVLSDVFSESAVSRVCADIVHKMARSFDVGDNQVYSSVSIGVSFFPDDAEDPDVLIIKADQAMYEVKAAGKNSWQFYTPSMQQESERKHRLYNELVEALKNNQFLIHYQPIVNATDGAIVGCEALIRWQKPDQTWVPPEEFIAVAEERGLISQIDLMMLTRSLEKLEMLNSRLEQPLSLSVNVSPRVLHLRDDDSREWMDLVTRDRRTPCTVEITERVLVSDSTMAGRVLDQLDECGVGIAIDDFGTGYSGLGYFSRFPIRTLKIDRSFVSRIGVSVTEEALLDSILLMADKLSLSVVAEGVETRMQADYLRNAGCHFLQGYYVGKPMPFAEFEQLVSQQKRTSTEESH